MKNNLENWPPVGGRYKIGNKCSPVAVCTNASVEGINLNMEKIAICGKCVTENIGIEKIIQNIISNPYVRFLILCGRVSKGHFVDQAIVSLKKNGIDKDKRIIGAKGNTPFLKGISKDLIEIFRQQVEPMNLMPEEDSLKIMHLVERCLEQNPGMFTGKPIKIKQVEEIEAKACPEWIPDPKGFFVISIDRNQNKILVEYFQKNTLTQRIIGTSAEEISKTIVNLDLIGNFEQSKEHAMYLARELQKAEMALKNGLDYEQDQESNLGKANQKQKTQEKESVNEDDWFD